MKMRGHVNQKGFFLDRDVGVGCLIPRNRLPAFCVALGLARGDAVQVQTKDAAVRRPVATGPSALGLLVRSANVVNGRHPLISFFALSRCLTEPLPGLGTGKAHGLLGRWPGCVARFVVDSAYLG